MNGIRTNIVTCNFRLCLYSINYYSYRKFCDIHILVLAIFMPHAVITYFKDETGVKRGRGVAIITCSCSYFT